MQFVSLKYKNLSVVLEQRIFKEVNGRAVVQGINGEFPNGMTIQFDNGVYDTNDKQVIDAIKNHPHYGRDFVAGADDAEPAELSTQAVREKNEKAEVVNELQSQCPVCGKEFASQQALAAHSRVHANKEATE